MAKIQRIRPPEEIPDSAMADVAFLLLIFFIATTTIAEEFGLSLILPAPSTSQTSMQVNRDNVMIISSDESGSVILVDEQAVNLSQIRPMFRERYAGNDKLVVSVEPHPNAPYRVMVDVLDELKMAKAPRISLKTRR
ncbi:MAG: biopolymer transporter ExbD [Candidatus Eisenbacteria bacterium]|uniref:Biopolymer transporter ExbD n=1 Tax=Eiseniibacteriota bacterium TaxID=2212470 RepID=A0A7Y2E924_UNCEI|nr:biopolymer transporter ExbD [Candidatus Eisenbacteria bacterium]